MAKVFKLHNVGTNTISDWGNSQQYGKQVIDDIQDPNINNIKNPITSIPSPFARIDLVRTAFEFVSKKNAQGQYPHIDGNTIYNKMVSDSLDVGQIFFEYDKHKNNVDIIAWDKTTDLQALVNSNNPDHQQLGQTYQLFLTQDAKQNNFDLLQRIYILNYKSQGLQVLGATSPRTLFFSTPNNLNNTTIYFGNNKAFDNNYAPLYKRDIEYHKFLHLLRISTPNFATLFPEMDAYLDASYQQSNQNRKNELNKLVQGDFSSYKDIAINGNIGNTVEIIGIPLKQKNSNGIVKSDFEIKSTKYKDNKMPLVLPVETFTSPWQYTSAPWDSNINVPYFNSTPFENRVLPQVGDQYPYLTISDFLEDNIIAYDGKFNSLHFWGGATTNDDNHTYLLPLKPFFFEFFSVEELIQKNMLHLEKNAGGVKAVLTIPTVKGSIQYSRIYFENNSAKIDGNHNEGALKMLDFAFASFSNIKFSNPELASYRLALLTQNNNFEEYQLHAYNEQGNLIDKANNFKGPVVRNTNDTSVKKCQVYEVCGENLGYIQIQKDNLNGMIIPKMHTQQGNDNFVFAVDFGTTNTHIAYSKNKGTTNSFDIQQEERFQDVQLQTLSEYGNLEQFIFDADLLPQVIGKGEFHFPMRTALSMGKNIDWKNFVMPMGHTNIPFIYEKRSIYPYDDIITDLKWSNEPNNISVIKNYIETVMLLLRNKVILNNGNLDATKLVWFYPVSMTTGRFNLFKDAWENAFKKHFGSQASIVPMTESVAPHEYYKAHFGVSNTVLIDIGGGTSDAVISNNGEIKCITSFRFASTSIFGNGYVDKQVASLNGIIKSFNEVFLDILKSHPESEAQELGSILTDLLSQKKSADIASFLFSLADNAIIKKLGISDNVNFNQKLAYNEDFRIIFLLFYSAIIYHIAQIIKLKGLKLPRKLAFSGNGSKIIQVISSNASTISQYTKAIFEKVMGEAYPKDGLDVIFGENPKEATCKGGIVNPIAQEYNDIANKKVVLLDGQNFVTNETYSSITREELSKIEKMASDFLEFFFKLDENNYFTKTFDISHKSIEIARRLCPKDLRIYLENGLEQRKQEVSQEETIEETLFFYPLVGLLNTLAIEIHNSNNNNSETI